MISILNYDFKSLNFFHFLLLLLPLTLVSGPFLPDLIVTLISFYFCFIFFIKKKFKSVPIINIFIIFFLVFYVVAIISSIFAIEPTVSLKSSISYIRFLLFALSTYYLLKDNLILINILSFIVLILIFFLSIDALFQYIFKYNLFISVYIICVLKKTTKSIFLMCVHLKNYLTIALLTHIHRKKSLNMPLICLKCVWRN